MFSDDETEYVSHLTNGENTPDKYIQKRDRFYKTILLRFEGRLFPASGNYDEILKRHYGDYVGYPPEKERLPTHGVVRVVTKALSDRKGRQVKKCALVVGGGNGVGLSLAAELLRRDYAGIYIADRVSPKVDDVPEDVRERFSDAVSFIRINLINQDYSCLPDSSEIDTLIISAGFGRVASFDSLTEAEIKNLVIVNELSVMMIVKKYYSRIFSDDDMYCAVMGSISGHVASPLFSVYGAAKSGVCRFIESVNAELAVNYNKNRILDVSPGVLEGTCFYGKGNSLDALGALPGEIIDKMFARERIYIPNCEPVYKNILEYYHSNPYSFAQNSYAYKITGGRYSELPQTKIGYLSGTFDLFHIGHLNILKRAKDCCDYLIVGVHKNGAWKGKETFIPFEERAEIVRGVKYVDRVIESFAEDMDAWDSLGYHYLFVGSDYKGSYRFKKYEQYFADKDVEIICFPYADETSSTQLREILQGVLDADHLSGKAPPDEFFE